MPRPRQRVCLQDGLKLDLISLARKGFVRRGVRTGRRGITWVHSYWGEIASGTVSADMSGQSEGWLRIELGSLDQWITLVAKPIVYHRAQPAFFAKGARLCRRGRSARSTPRFGRHGR
jgi:hypothetical protein